MTNFSPRFNRTKKERVKASSYKSTVFYLVVCTDGSQLHDELEAEEVVGPDGLQLQETAESHQLRSGQVVQRQLVLEQFGELQDLLITGTFTRVPNLWRCKSYDLKVFKLTRKWSFVAVLNQVFGIACFNCTRHQAQTFHCFYHQRAVLSNHFMPPWLIEHGHQPSGRRWRTPPSHFPGQPCSSERSPRWCPVRTWPSPVWLSAPFLISPPKK